MADCNTVDEAMEVDVQQVQAEGTPEEGMEAIALETSLDIRPEAIMESAANTVRPLFISYPVMGTRMSVLPSFQEISFQV